MFLLDHVVVNIEFQCPSCSLPYRVVVQWDHPEPHVWYVISYDLERIASQIVYEISDGPRYSVEFLVICGPVSLRWVEHVTSIGDH